MSTWEERMAARARRRTEPDAVPNPAVALTEAAVIERYAEELRTEAKRMSRLVACACVGPPPGCVRCRCALLLAAENMVDKGERE